ncbi:SLBB domain-containing protein [Candidatus Neomarinimicrobiota bacterium]
MSNRLEQIMVLIVLLVTVVVAQAQGTNQKDQIEEAMGGITVPPYRAQVVGTALEQPIDPAAYIVGPGDVFLISIIALEPYLTRVTVTPSGKLMVPMVGSLEVNALTAEEVSRRVLASIRKAYPTYEADCTLYGIREIRVSLTGAVPKPAFYRVTPIYRISDLLYLAGGWKANAALHRIRFISRAGDSRIVDLTDYFHQGDLTQNPLLKEGDQVVIPYSEIHNEMISMRGLVTVPAYYTIKPCETLAAFIGRWYDERSKAEISGMQLHRYGEDGQKEVRAVTDDQFASVELQAGDILYVNVIPGVDVVGEVKRPGHYEYYPDLTADDYLTYAGGITREGSQSKVVIIQANGEKARGGDTEIQAGDVINVNRSFRSIMVGGMGLVQVALAVLNLYLIAAR